MRPGAAPTKQTDIGSAFRSASPPSAAVRLTARTSIARHSQQTAHNHNLAADAESGFDRVLAADLPHLAVISSGGEMPLACNGQADPDNGRRPPIRAACELTLSAAVRRLCANKRIDDVDCPPRRAPKRPARPPQRAPLGKRWIVERTNSWLSNFGQLRRNTDRTTGQLALAIIAIKLIKWADRHNQ